jgi:hypothetical protein
LDNGSSHSISYSVANQRRDTLPRRDSSRSFGEASQASRTSLDSSSDNLQTVHDINDYRRPSYGPGPQQVQRMPQEQAGTNRRPVYDNNNGYGNGIDGGSLHSRSGNWNNGIRDNVRGQDYTPPSMGPDIRRPNRHFPNENEYNNSGSRNPPIRQQQQQQQQLPPPRYSNGRENGGGYPVHRNGPNGHYDRPVEGGRGYSNGPIDYGTNRNVYGATPMRRNSRVDSDDFSVGSGYHTVASGRYADNAPIDGRSVSGRSTGNLDPYASPEKRKYTPPLAPYSMNDRIDPQSRPTQPSYQHPTPYSPFDQPSGQSRVPVHGFPPPSPPPQGGTQGSIDVNRGTQIEISPGVFERLRGAKETSQAVDERNVAFPTCMVCCSQLACIADAQYVLCPSCKVVSPVFDDNGRPGPIGGGVGLGLLASELNTNNNRNNRNYQQQNPNQYGVGRNNQDAYDNSRYYSGRR